jgi:hypothetical protein
MELPSSTPKSDFVHNSAAFIPFSYGESPWSGIWVEFFDALFVQVLPTVSESRWRCLVSD